MTAVCILGIKFSLFCTYEINDAIFSFHSGPKNDPPSIVQEKVLNLIQSWADAFHNQPELSAVVQIYNDLKKKGIEFPMTDLDTMAPIHTPRKVCQFIILFYFFIIVVLDARMICRQSIFHFIVLLFLLSFFFSRFGFVSFDW